MTHLFSARIGKTVVRVTSEGCFDCGTLFSASWHESQTVSVQIGRRSASLALWRCLSCHRKAMMDRAGRATPAASAGSGPSEF